MLTSDWLIGAGIVTEAPSDSFVVIHSPEHGPGEKIRKYINKYCDTVNLRTCDAAG